MTLPQRALRQLLPYLRRPELHEVALAGYRRERFTEVSFPMAIALMEGGFVGVLADKIFHVHPILLAFVSAAPMFGNLSSFAWAALGHGRPKVPLVAALQGLFAALVAAIALLPEGQASGVLLVCCMVASRLVLSGITTLRSLVWTLNYPREARARVTSRLALCSSLVITAASVSAGWLLDADPASFRWLYAGGAVAALCGVTAFSRVRVLGEHEHLALERGASQPDGERRALRPARAALALLRHDRLYARYLGWQFLLGVSNMMIEAPLIYLVSRELGASYSVSIAMTLAIPLGVSLLTLPLWAAYLDRVHIAEFRSRHSWLFAISQLLLWVGALQGSLALIALARVVLGAGASGGSLAWQLGHNDFAEPERVGLYMGVHATLTGLRGAFAPFLGMLLYVGWGAVPIPFAGIGLPAFAGIGGHVMLISSALAAIATLGFTRLHRAVGARGARPLEAPQIE